MSVLINFKICDNVCECGGIVACPTGALFWNKEKDGIGIDNEKCASCGVCVGECPVGAIKVARSEEEYEEIKRGIENDPRRVSDLFIERYGAMPVHPDVLIDYDGIENEIEIQTKPLFVELFRDDDLMCLRKSVPIRELIPGKDIVFRKVRVDDEKRAVEDYGVSKFPCLLLFRDGLVLGRVEGYFGDDDKDELTGKVADLVGKLMK